MMNQTVTTIIDRERCRGCGRCVKVCPSRTLSLVDGKAAVTGDRSIACGHCAAVCPEKAVRVTSLENDALAFKTFRTGERWIRHGDFDTAGLVRLMRSRRSCRNFRQKPVPRDMLEDLVRIGMTAPSGTNSQQWMFTILPHRDAVLHFGLRIAKFFRRLNFLSERSLLRLALRAAGRPELDHYYREHHDRIKEGLEEWDRTGRDLLFHGAPACIVVSSRPGASCPSEDALLAAQNILLGAHAMGLGTCLIGYAVEAIRAEPAIKKEAGIPEEERVYAVIVAGYPAEKYRRLTGRRALAPRFFPPGS
jgi:nitroreductase/NAD-dependent dihydropyrimidine dehydrogenase PreA subunit